MAPKRERDEKSSLERYLKVNRRNGDISWFKKSDECLLPVPVLNQGNTKTCWAFAIVEAIYAFCIIKNIIKKHHKLSTQFLIDCVHLDDPSTPKDKDGKVIYNIEGFGSSFRLAFNFIRKHGIPLEHDYGTFCGNCQQLEQIPFHYVDETRIKIKAFGYGSVDKLDKLWKRLEVQPIYLSILIPPSFENWPRTTGQKSWDIYEGPLPEEWEKHLKAKEHNASLIDGDGKARDINEFRNHAVLLIAVRRNHQVPHFTIKNNWGPNFGLDGHLKIAIKALSQLLREFFYPRKPEVVKGKRQR